jgi:glutamate formiminotransferase
MAALIECIPNVSEGRRGDVVAALAEAAVKAAPGVVLLDRTSDADHNRSVLTFLGEGEALVVAMTALVGAALDAIDLRKHAGAHPRLGAVDVIPFVPVRGATTADCVALAKTLGKTLADRYGLPVYLYEDAASRPDRQNLANIRKGEFEGLASKMADPAWHRISARARRIPPAARSSSVRGRRSSLTTSTWARPISRSPTASRSRSGTSRVATAS